jgi:diaminopimelate decarboxylase
MLSALAKERGLVLRVLLRLSSGNQFGMDEAAITGILQNRERYSGLVFAGLQYFTGTQKKMKRILSEVSYLDEVMERLLALTAGEGPEYFRELEYGPGLPVSYFTGDHAPEDSELLSELREALSNMRFSGRITLEMGRFIVAKSGYYLTKVVDMKENEGAAYCIVDGGIHQMNYFGQMMGMKLPSMQLLRGDGEEIPGPENRTVCGSLCTTADVLVRDCPLPGLRINDLLVFEQTGAYSMTEGISLFLSRDLPWVYLYEGGSLKEMRKQINTEDWNCGRTDCDT